MPGSAAAGPEPGKLNLGHGPVVFVGREERNRLEAEGSRDQVARKGLEGGVVVPGAGVVVAPGELDLVLGGRQRLLQLEEAFDRPQLRVVLGHREQRSKRPGQGVLGGRDLAPDRPSRRR